ncbi:flagellar basal body rod protein FlgC [Roseiconus lacunae]|uniref:Flagellar basal-body rod protein FlgC n=1 Tax=Roseiconus lacunae TaxID=2605694 RepID=A0ABT7PDD5_9BACT|nr:flagellar basal body rod protein FlgC [Roseiconus lacunae]MCD0459820.1 flagellar basal body rod protein FlgC [Roseiconus lacunae]MDM4014518.1 flagellar basal body rod protein FlgC [Roseiconus lacunae]WRQ49831.1 flagellar basal body rod protein FlgC [Stieleria sp. HD01]
MVNFPTIDIAASGLAAERFRMEVTANNLANASTTMTENGDPYRRQAVVFAAGADPTEDPKSAASMHGVQVVGVQPDGTDFPTIYNPSHPHADAEGFVRLSNVKIPEEMVDLITASRSYEANTKAISVFKEMVEQTLTLLQGGQ